MSIRARTILIVILTNLLIILFSVSAGYVYVKSGIEKSQEMDLMTIANIADHFISSEIELLKLRATVIAQSLAESEETKWPQTLANQETVYPVFIGMAVLDAERGLIASAGKVPAHAELVNDKYVRQAFLRRKVFSSTIPSSDGVVFYLAVPIPGHRRILAVTVPGMYFARRLSTITIWKTGHIIIDDAEGNVIANIRPDWVQNRVNFIRMAETDKQYGEIAGVIERGTRGETGVGHFSVSGVPRICAYRPISASREGWFLGVIAPLPDSPFRNIDKGLAMVGLVAFMLSVIAAVIASSYIKKPFEEVAALKEAAEAGSKSKSDFLANMSHEIRTPMNAILGITEIQLMNETLSPNIKEALSKIYSSGELLLGIINDILDLSKIEAGKLELAPVEYDAASLINDTVVLNMMRLSGKPVEFELSVEENMPSKLFGDELRIKQIMNNLLSNAFKYTEKGHVKLSISFETGGAGEESEITLVFRVSDTGRGMTKEQANKLFDDEYSRFDMEANRTTEGTGLGMNITRKLLNLMNGEIFVESELNKGTVFIVHLPQKKVGEGVLGKELVENLQNFRVNSATQIRRAQVVFEPMPYGSVLVVDDVESNLYVAKGLLAPYGLSIHTAMSGFEAVDNIKDGKVYDIVFMDHMMPGMDGIETTKIMRDMGYEEPVIALTANAVVGQAEVFLANGFDDCISKPVDVRQLNAVLKKYIRDKQSPEIIEDALRQKGRGGSASGGARPTVIQRLAEVFARDAAKAVTVLEAIDEKRGAFNEEEIREFTVRVHGMKSVLASIGEKALSAEAAQLEKAGHEKDAAVISSQTPVFLNGLRAVINKFAPPKEEDDDGDIVDYDRGYLREKLLSVIKACEIYDKKAAKTALAELDLKAWPSAVRNMLSTIAELLLNGDFEEIPRVAEKTISLN